MIFVFIAGASASGKTSFAKTLASSLCEKGVSACTISLDDYYLLENKRINQAVGDDIPEAYDIPLLHEHLIALENGNSINTPKYDLGTYKHLPQTTLIAPEGLKVVIIEGIFALHDYNAALVTHKMSVFVETDWYLNYIVRRSARDKIERDTSPAETIEREPKKGVRNGFFNHILPCKRGVDHVITNNKNGDIDSGVAEISHEILKKLGAESVSRLILKPSN